MTTVMGFDQHRAQITAEWLWLDAGTSEVVRSRITPTHRAEVRRFCEQLRAWSSRLRWKRRPAGGSSLMSCGGVDAVVHLAEPAETAARGGNKKQANSDHADARHIRELLMIGRLPESWIAPDHILDLRARVRLRHTLSCHDDRGVLSTAPAPHWPRRSRPTIRSGKCADAGQRGRQCPHHFSDMTVTWSPTSSPETPSPRRS